MAPKPILRKRRVLLLLLLLTVHELVFTWSPAVFCALAVPPPVTDDHVDRTEIPTHRHVLHFALSTFFGRA